VVFELPLPVRADSVTLVAKIVWEDRPLEAFGTGSSITYGLCFDQMDNVSQLILDAYLDFLRRDVHIVQLEQAWKKLRKVQEKIEILVACEERKNVTVLH